MKELVEDFKAIAKKDKHLFVWMAINFLLSLPYFLVPIFNLNFDNDKIHNFRYSDITGGYEPGPAWLLISFSLLAFALGIGHTLIAARIYTKRGKDTARLFLFITMMITIVGIRYLLYIFEKA